MLLGYWQTLKMHVYMYKHVFLSVFASCSIITVAPSLPVAIINQPVFTSDVAMCEMHSMHHPGIHSSYATEQQLYL